MKLRLLFAARLFLPFAVLSLAKPSALANSANWTGVGTDALWSNTANWSVTPVPGSADTATFTGPAGAGGKVIDLGSGVTVNTINFSGSTCDAYTIGAGGANAQTLVLNGGIGLTSGINFTQTITVNAAITLNNTSTWTPQQGNNPYVINGNVTANGTAGLTKTLTINGRSFNFNGILADQSGGAKLAISGANANTVTLTNNNNTFTGGIYTPNGTVSVSSISMTGSPSAAGAGGVINFGDGFGGGILTYTGAGNTTDRVLNLATVDAYNGATLYQSGTGLLKFTADWTATGKAGKTIILRGATAGKGEMAGKIIDSPSSATTTTASGGAIAGGTTIVITNSKAAAVGSYVSGTGVATGTYVTANSSGTITLSQPVIAPGVANSQSVTFSGSTSVTKTDSGTWTLSGLSSYSNLTTLSSGNLVASSLNYIFSGNLASHATGSSLGIPTDVYHGTIAIGSGTTASALTYNGTGETSDRVINLGGTTGGSTLDQSGTGLLKFTSALTATGAGAKTLTLQGSTAGTGEIAAAIVDNSITNKTSLAKAGTGTWALSGLNTFTGTTTVSGGTLLLDYTSQNNQKLANNAALTLSACSLTLKGGTFTELASATTLNAGGTFLTHANSSTSQINLQAITRTAGATIDFGDAVIAQTSTSNVNGILGGWATVAGSDWAVSGNPATALAAYTGGLPQTGGANTANYTLTGPQSQTGAVLANTIKMASSGSGDTLGLGANNLTLTYTSATSLGGILYVGGGDNNYNITGTGKLITSSTTGELVINVKTGNLTISAPIVASGATAGLLTKTGAGTLTLSTAESYTGATRINLGTLIVNGSISSGAATVQPGATLGGIGTVNGPLTVNAGGTILLGSSGSTLALASSTAPVFNAYGTLKIAAAALALDKLSLTNATPTFACGNLNLVVDTTGLTGTCINVEIVHTANAAGISGTFASVSVIGNTSYLATVNYGANSITLTLTNSLTSPSSYQIQVAGSSSATTSAGASIALTVTALNPSGVALTSLNGDAILSFYGLASSPNSTVPAITDKTGTSRAVTAALASPTTTLTFVNGVATVSGSLNGLLTAYKAATATLHCSDGVASSTSGTGAAGLSLTVNPVAIASYSVTAPSPQVTSAIFSSTVTALDTYGNTVTTDSSTVVTLTSSGSAQFDSNGDGTFGDNTKTLSNGNFTINTKDNGVENITLTATSSGGKTGTSTSITINANSAKNILTFTFPTYGAATISGTNITKTVPFGTSVTSMAPTYTLSAGANGNPVSGSALDFTNPRTYAITAMDNTSQTYTVTVTIAPQPTTFTWVSAAPGNWSSAANWSNNVGDGTAPAPAGYANYTLNFTPSGTYTVTDDLNNGFLLNQANFAGAVTLAGTNGITFTNNGATLPQLNQNSSSGVTLSVPLAFNANVTCGGSSSGSVAISGAISGTGSLTKTTSGTLTLSGANTYSGGTIVNSGTLSMGATANNLLGTGTVTVNSGATLALNGNNNLTNSFVFNGATVSNGNSFSANIYGPITLGATTIFDLGTTGNMTLGGNMSGAGGLTKKGTAGGAVNIIGANTFTGPVTVLAGTLQVASVNSVSGGVATSSLGAPTTLSDGTISLGNTTTSVNLTYTGAGETTDRVIKLAGTTGGATLTLSGPRGGLLKFTSNLSIPGSAGVDNRKTLTLTSVGTAAVGSTVVAGEIAGSIGDSLLGSAGQLATSVTKAGPNIWTLSGANSYTGGTKVQAGTLAFSQATALGSGSLDITSGAKVQLNYIGTRQISALTFNGGSAQPNGSYGSSASLATNKDDTHFAGLGTVTVGPLASSPTVALALGSGSNPSNGGGAVTFAVTVTGSQPTGYVLFYDGITQLGAGTLNASHQATFSTSLLAGGSHSITAVYPGDSNNGPGYSNALTQTVADARSTTTTSLARTAGSNPSAFTGTVTFTATVTGSVPTGLVAFYDSSILLGTATLNGSAQAVLTTGGLAVGWRALTAAYLGDSVNAPSATPSTLFQTVSPPPGNGKWKVFILAGQSNMQGKASVETGRDPNNYAGSIAGGLGSLRNMLNKNVNRYGYLSDPANPVGGNPGWLTRSDVSVTYWSDPGAGENRRGNLDPYFGNNGEGTYMGPEYAFGLVVGSQMADQVVLIKYAFGGRSLAGDFRPPGAVAARGGSVGPYYTGMVSRVNQVLGNLSTYFPSYTGGGYEITGFAWHQGWNDRVTAAYANEYEANLANLIQDLRTDLNAPNLPVSIGSTGMANVDLDANGLTVIAAQAAVANSVLHPEFTGTVATVDTRPFDFGNAAGGSDEGYHWNRNAESYFNIGEKMGEAIMSLLGSQSTAKDILAFAVPGQTSSTISGTNISITVPAGSDISALVPTFTLSPLATATPVTGTSRNFTAPQTYTVTAQNLTTKTYTVTVAVSTSPYADWAANPAQGLTAGVNDGPLADPDHDGITNLMEFVLGSAPMVSSQSKLPTLKAANGQWLFEYDRNRASLPPVTTQIVQYSSDMKNWNDVPVTANSFGAVTVAPGSTFDHVAVTIPSSNPQTFVRLKVAQ